MISPKIIKGRSNKYASALHAIGVPDQYIMKYGGWKNPAMLHSVYRNTLSDYEEINARKATNYFDEINEDQNDKTNDLKNAKQEAEI